MSNSNKLSELSPDELDQLETSIHVERTNRENQTNAERLVSLVADGVLVTIACLVCEGVALVADHNGDDETCAHCDCGVMCVVSAKAKHRWSELTRLPGVYYG